MKELTFEVVVSVLILSLLVVVIGLFRNNMDIINYSANSVSEMEKIKADSMLQLEKDEFTGSDVISIIRYYSNDSNVKVVVNANSKSKEYISNTYDSNNFYIAYDWRFKGKFKYEESKLIKAEFIKN